MSQIVICQGNQDLDALANAEGVDFASYEWLRRKRGELAAEGWTTADVDALTVVEPVEVLQETAAVEQPEPGDYGAYVTAAQMGAIVQRSKETIRRLVDGGELP